MLGRLIGLVGVFWLSLPAWAAPITVAASYDATTFDGPFSGRVVVFFSKGGREPRLGPNWFRPEPMAAVDVANLRAGETVSLDNSAIHFPGPTLDLPEGEWRAQVVFDRNLGGRAIGRSPGNLVSEVTTFTVGTEGAALKLVASRVLPEREFKETEFVKEVRLRSGLLSEFYGRETFLKAAVRLPEGYTPGTPLPAMYVIPGFGGTHYDWSGLGAAQLRFEGDEPMAQVLLNPDCPTGHSVFADSANNGPWGRALTEELIPHLEERFGLISEPWARLVSGHSSGGWSSLWLQVAYPGFFGGCWSTAPDPVDFHHFMSVNIYESGANFYRSASGEDLPLIQDSGRLVATTKQFSDMERPLRGEQLESFEAVFGPRAADGSIVRLWDRQTGKIDPAVAEYWKKYDINKILIDNREQLVPKLAGKLHVYMGDNDTFFLTPAVQKMLRDHSPLPSGIIIEIVPGDHGSMLTSGLRRKMAEQQAAAIRRGRELHQVGRIDVNRQTHVAQ